ncbi:MAG TPA: PEGA domain-containing protein [Candidatus Paceibacterota bacterium]|nr:PEGA domain-containing protein [Candidatus Paceibacterota bacterium]
MTRKARRTIFYTLLALFFVVGSGVVLYAEGWRVDLTTWRPEKVGAIYIRSYPQSAAITLNGKPVGNQSGFLSPGTLISDLLPHTYRVSLQAPGYDDWHENAAVLPSFVVQFRYAVLVPRDGMPAPTGTVAGSAYSSVKQYLALSSAAAAPTTTDPFDPSQKAVAGKNKVSVFSATQATTTLTIAVSGWNAGVTWLTPTLLGILQSDGELYLYNTNARQLRKLADDVRSFSATPDGSMVAALEYRSMEVFSLSDPGVYYRFNPPDIAAAQRTFWYADRTHLFVIYPDHVSFLDLADATLTNFTTVADGTSPFYDEAANKLFILTPARNIAAYAFPS